MISIEIERLVQWTYCSELPKRRRFGPGLVSAWQKIERYAELGCRIDRGSLRREFDSASVPSGDAFIVEDEVNKLRPSVTVDWHQSKEFLLGDLSMLAESVELAINFNEIELVQYYARRRISPDWNPGRPKATPSIGPNGKPTLRGTRYGKDRYSEGAHCPLQWGAPTIESISLARATYIVWWRSLDRLAKSLNGRMKHHVVRAPATLAAPWRIK
jgi:hypothetical protein